MKRLTPSRRSFLVHASLGGLLTAWSRGGDTVLAGVETPFPLLRWKTAAEVRAQADEVWRLVDLINAFRRQSRLPEAPLSPRLTAVAVEHVRDLIYRRPQEATGNLHSWSRTEPWKGGDYRADDKTTWPIMWDKPREIAGYDGFGFEVAAANVDDPDHALRAWRGSPQHLEVILSRGVWSQPRWQWKALGAAFHQGFACAWFGAEADRA